MYCYGDVKLRKKITANPVNDILTRNNVSSELEEMKAQVWILFFVKDTLN